MMIMLELSSFSLNPAYSLILCNPNLKYGTNIKLVSLFTKLDDYEFVSILTLMGEFCSHCFH